MRSTSYHRIFVVDYDDVDHNIPEFWRHPLQRGGNSKPPDTDAERFRHFAPLPGSTYSAWRLPNDTPPIIDAGVIINCVLQHKQYTSERSLIPPP